jgi:hypothetical protein
MGRSVPARPATVPPVLVRQRIPSISWRLLQVGGRPAFLPAGNSGSSLAHCSLVRSPRPMLGASHQTLQLLKHALVLLSLKRPEPVLQARTPMRQGGGGATSPRPGQSPLERRWRANERRVMATVLRVIGGRWRGWRLRRGVGSSPEHPDGNGLSVAGSWSRGIFTSCKRRSRCATRRGE